MNKLNLVCLLLFLTSCNTNDQENSNQDASGSETIDSTVNAEIINIIVSPNANYLHDFYESIKKGDLRFIGVMGYAMEVPGVEDYHEKYSRTIGVKIIEGTTDDYYDSIVNHNNILWEEYAKNYNLMLLEYLKQQK